LPCPSVSIPRAWTRRGAIRSMRHEGLGRKFAVARGVAAGGWLWPPIARAAACSCTCSSPGVSRLAMRVRSSLLYGACLSVVVLVGACSGSKRNFSEGAGGSAAAGAGGTVGNGGTTGKGGKSASRRELNRRTQERPAAMKKRPLGQAAVRLVRHRAALRLAAVPGNQAAGTACWKMRSAATTAIRMPMTAATQPAKSKAAGLARSPSRPVASPARAPTPAEFQRFCVACPV
jgi:hypothetical protein